MECPELGICLDIGTFILYILSASLTFRFSFFFFLLLMSFVMLICKHRSCCIMNNLIKYLHNKQFCKLFVYADKQRMGCINSRADINDLHPNIFQVINVDDLGNSITPGRLEVTDVELILYQRGKQPITWSLHCLRRYGYDASIFSFESGRRCFTGPAIYAFKCQRAQQLFNLVQRNIQVCIVMYESTCQH